MTTKLRICTKCQEEKPLDQFPKQKGRPDGRRPDCKKCHASYRRRNYAKKRSQYREYQRSYSERHRDVVVKRNREKRARWREKNRELHRQEARRRYLGKNDLACEFAEILRCDPCCYCGSQHEHVDHIVPISQGGESSWDNLTSACQSCNNKKIDKPMLLFLLEK